jgi:hypothetical protein
MPVVRRVNASLVGHSEGNEHHQEVRSPNEQAERVTLIANLPVLGLLGRSGEPGTYASIRSTQIYRIADRDCPKSLGRPYNVALRETEIMLFRFLLAFVYWPDLGRSVAPTPFRTVSQGEF